MLKDYQGIPTGETYTYESVIEKSRFIANIRHVDTVAEAVKSMCFSFIVIDIGIICS